MAKRKTVAKTKVKKPKKVETEIPQEVMSDITLSEPKKVIPKVEIQQKVKNVLYAVDSFSFDDRIKADSKDPMKKVTVLVKNKYSKANVEMYLRSGSLRLIDTFSGQFGDEKFDVGFVEKSMREFIPQNILNHIV